MPENSFPGFIHAVELQVSTIHMDVVISKDSQIVISHNPWMSAIDCSNPDGTPIDKKVEKELNLYQMDYNQLQLYDCGKRFNPDFPEQRKMTANKPTLKMVIRMVRGFAEDNKYPQPNFNIEIRSNPKWYNKYQPEPKQLVALVTSTIRRLGIEDITTIQSTDLQVLEELNKIPEHTYRIGYVVTKGKSLEKNLSKLSFKPDGYCPDFNLVTEALVTECHETGIRVLPWTINNKEDMGIMKSMGCDGAFTDYPDGVR